MAAIWGHPEFQVSQVRTETPCLNKQTTSKPNGFLCWPWFLMNGLTLGQLLCLRSMGGEQSITWGERQTENHLQEKDFHTVILCSLRKCRAEAMTHTLLCTTHKHLRLTFVWWAPLHTGEHRSRRKRSLPRNCLCHLGIEDGGWYSGVITATTGLRDPHGFLHLVFLDRLIHKQVRGQQCFEQGPLLWQCFQHPLRPWSLCVTVSLVCSVDCVSV